MLAGSNFQETLEKIGLSKEEAAIYLILAEHGSMTVSAISKNTGLHRPGIYKALPMLQNKELVTAFPRGRQKLYTAEAPEKLKTLFENMINDFDALLPDLEMAYREKSKRPSIKFLEGSRGIRFVFKDVIQSLKRGDIFYRYTSAKNKIKNETKYLPPEYKKIRDIKQLQRLVISGASHKDMYDSSLDRSVKFVPENYGLFDYNVTEIIYGNKVAFIDYNTETALIIENTLVATFQQKIFKLLWDKL